MKLLDKNTFCKSLTHMERLLRFPTPPVTILGYHAISSDATIVDIDVDMFKRQLEILKNSCEFVSIDQVVRFIQGKATFSRPAVAITFDDGYANVFHTVLPILTKEHIPATVFVLSDAHNANREELANNKKMMTIKEMQTVHAVGWTIGCHSATHANFADKNLNRQKEIIDSKIQLEKELGFPIDYFAYPKGIFTQDIVYSVKDAGFTAAFAFESGFISSKTNMFTIPRMPVDWTHTEEQFSAFFTNWGVIYMQAKQQRERKAYLS